MKAKSEVSPRVSHESAEDRPIESLPIDADALTSSLVELLSIPSPAGYTDTIVHFVARRLEEIGVAYELTRRGGIRANLEGARRSPDRAVVSHLDTLGAQVKYVKDNGRLELVPIGTWSARFAEGARVTIFSDEGSSRGTIMPLKASGHVYNEEIDTQPVGWEHIELRPDVRSETRAETEAAGIQIGDFVAIDPQPEVIDSGFIVSRHLDDKAGVAAMLTALEAIVKAGVWLPVDCHFLFTISEEVGSGASSILHGDVAELVAVDNSTIAPGQNSGTYGVTVAMADSTGPFDYHLTHKLIEVAKEHEIPHCRDVFRYYRCDAASAIEAGNDIRTALITFGLDASHGYERTHIDSLVAVAKLLTLYVQTPPAVDRDRREMSSITGFPVQPA